VKKGQQRQEIERLRRKAMKRGLALKTASLTDNEVAEKVQGTGDPLLVSMEWKALRRVILNRYGAKCMCCGVVPTDPTQVNVDHVKPRKFYPELALDPDNLQVLCGRCNKRKGNKDTDYRHHPAAAFV
jgi:5-methylcytosine-specific restriction endonuclease McrA